MFRPRIAETPLNIRFSTLSLYARMSTILENLVSASFCLHSDPLEVSLLLQQNRKGEGMLVGSAICCQRVQPFPILLEGTERAGVPVNTVHQCPCVCSRVNIISDMDRD